MSRRQEQLASVLREAIQEVIGRGLNDPRVSGMITVTRVDLSPDLEYATARISVLPEDRQTLTFHGVKAASAFIRRQVGDLVKNRKLPKLQFELDTTLKSQLKVIEAIERAKDAPKPTGWGAKSEAPGEGGGV